jgi:hypothetical protein
MHRTLIVQVVILLAAVAATAEDKAIPVLGQWEGESNCTVKNSPCHDEHVIYRVTENPKTSGQLAIAAYKVVNGKELYMGDLECQYAADASELRCHYKPTDSWVFKLVGDTMTGTLTIEGNTLYRKISVKRVPSTPVK